MNTTISIRIQNPAMIARQFGECPGDYANDRCRWWVGTVNELYPADKPRGKIINAPVHFCGGGAHVARLKSHHKVGVAGLHSILMAAAFSLPKLGSKASRRQMVGMSRNLLSPVRLP